MANNKENMRLIQREETVELINKAYAKEMTFSNLKGIKLSTGIRLDNFVTQEFGGIINVCESLNIDLEKFIGKGYLTKYYRKQLTKDDVDTYLKTVHTNDKAGLSKSEINSSSYGSAVLSKSIEVYGDYCKALISNGITPQQLSKSHLNEIKHKVVGMYKNGHSGLSIQRKLFISATSVFGILKEYGIEASTPSEIAKRNGNRGSVSAGLMFEDVLGEILTLTGVNYTKYDHELYNPDFVVEGRWIDAKLTHRTGSTNTFTNYTKHCHELEYIYLIGPITKRTSKRGLTRTSVYLLLDQIEDINVKKSIETKLTEIKDIASSEYDSTKQRNKSRDTLIISMVLSGASFRKTANALGINACTVSKICANANIKSKAKTGRPKSSPRKEVV